MFIQRTHDLTAFVEDAVSEAIKTFPPGTSLEVFVETTEDLQLVIKVAPLEETEEVAQ